MPVALVVGDYNPDDEVVSAFEDEAGALGYDCLREPNYWNAAQHLSDPPHDADYHLVLFCVAPGLSKVSERLRRLQSCRRRTVVYAHTSKASADLAIRYSREGLAEGYLVMGDGATARSIKDLVLKVHRGQPPYSPITLQNHGRTRNDTPTAFISTPFREDHRRIMEVAVDLALRELGFNVEWAERDYSRSLHDSIVEGIKRSSILIANISVDEQDVRHNPNVYFEAGIAAASRLPIVFVRRSGESKIPLPADIHGRGWLSYDNEIDLALRLYHGLR